MVCSCLLLFLLFFLCLIWHMFMFLFSNRYNWKFICLEHSWPSSWVWFTSGSRRGLPTAPSRHMTGGGWGQCASSYVACVHVWSSAVSFSSKYEVGPNCFMRLCKCISSKFKKPTGMNYLTVDIFS